MVLKEKEGEQQSETKANLEIMRKYIDEHFARIREEWEIKCLPNEIWAQQGSETYLLEEHSHFRQQQHNSSAVQRYADTNEKRRQQIDVMGGEIRLNEIQKEMQKISNRKAVGKDQIAAGTFKENRERLAPIRQQLYNTSKNNNATPKAGLKGRSHSHIRRMQLTT